MDEGGFIIDYHSPVAENEPREKPIASWLQAEEMSRATPEVESCSRRTGARLALAIAEPNTGDFPGQAQARPASGTQPRT